MPRTNSTDWSSNDSITARRLQHFNEDIDNIYAKWNDRIRASRAISGNPLDIDVGAGSYIVWTARGLYSGETDVTLTNNATNYIMITEIGLLEINTSGRDSDKARIAIVTTSWWVITNIEQWRPDIIWWDIWWWFPFWGDGEDTVISLAASWDVEVLSQLVEWIEEWDAIEVEVRWRLNNSSWGNRGYTNRVSIWALDLTTSDWFNISSWSWISVRYIKARIGIAADDKTVIVMESNRWQPTGAWWDQFDWRDFGRASWRDSTSDFTWNQTITVGISSWDGTQTFTRTAWRINHIRPRI